MAKVTLLFGNDPQGEFPLAKSEVTVGRSRDCDILVDNLGVSRHHCSFVQDGESWKIVDGGSNNGTFVNGTQVTEHNLQHNDRVVLGKFSLLYDAYSSADDVADSDAGKGGGGGAMGSEMTMFMDPDAIQKMQQQMSSGGGTESVKRLVLAVQQGASTTNVPISKSETLIGKGIDADIPIKGMFVKPVQAKVIKTDGGHMIVAMGGLRGVKVNGSKITQKQLAEGDTILVAGTTIFYRAG